MANGLSGAVKITTIVNMNKVTVTATDANRNFSRLLRSVKHGARVTITSHGEPVAVICALENAISDEVKARRARALERIAARRGLMPKEPIGRWTRDELYDEIIGL